MGQVLRYGKDVERTALEKASMFEIITIVRNGLLLCEDDGRH